MKIKGGYTKKILSIDLNKEKAVLEEVSDDFALQYVGGRGWGAKLVWDNLKNNNFNINPLGSENIVVIAPGPLTGLYLPSSGKTSFVSISPATKIYGDSSMGGMFGVELRQAGYDALVLSGTANKWSYIWIDDDKIEIRDADKYKGKGCIETQRQIKEDLGDEEVKVATIGPAGENLVKFACINSEWSRNAGRTGIGAVLGSKKVKAIVVRGSKDIPVYDMDKLVDVSNHAYERLMGHKLIEFWQQQGLMSVVDYINTAGVMPTHNFKDGYFKDAEKINGYIMERYKIGDTACFSCPMACGNVCLVKDGKYLGTVTEGPEYETACMFGSNVGISDFSAILRANYLCDEMGVDTISTGNLIAVVIEGYEGGILSLEDLDGVAIKWGEDEPILALIEKIAKREGIGNILAEGSLALIEKYPELKPIISQVKGLEQSAYDARVGVTMALGYATSDIGAHHTRAWPLAKEIELGKDWSLEERADLVIYHQTVRPLFDMLGVCRLPWIELGFPENIYAEFYSAATGVKVTLQDLLEKSKKVYDLTRCLNVKLGITKKDDYPPDRVFNNPIKTGPHAGAALNRDTYEKLLDIYYKKRGWNEDGIPVDCEV